MAEERIIPGGKALVQHNYDGIEITIKLPKNIPMIIFMSVWLCGWVMGEIFASGALIGIFLKAKSFSDIGPGFFLIFWLCGWTVGGYFAITSVLRSAIGKDIIKINSSQLSYAEKIGEWGKEKLYDIPQIKNLRVIQNSTPSVKFGSRRGSSNPGGPALAFDYSGNTVEIAKNLTLEEVEALLDLLWKNSWFNQDNFARSVVREKTEEDENWEEDTEKKSADRDVEFQRKSDWSEDKKKDDSEDVYYADI